MQKLFKNLPYIICYVIAFALGMKQLREPDVWWQLLSGRWMIEHGQITKTDMFSFTMAGKPWINVKWLYEIFAAGLEKLAGPEGVILLQSVVNVLIVYLLFKTLKIFSKQLAQPVSKFFTVLSVMLFLAIVEYRMAGRPEMMSHLLCAIYVFILLRDPRMQWKSIAILVLLQCLWANMHEGYPVGMVIIGTAAAGSLLAYMLTRQKEYLQQSGRVFIIFIAAGLAILLNPNTVQLWKQPFEIYRQVWANKYTTELYSYKDIAYWTIEAKCHIVLLVLVVAFWVWRLFNARRTNTLAKFKNPVILGYLLLIPLFAYLSLTANRNIPFAQIILFPSIPIMLTWMVMRFKLEQKKYLLPIAKCSAVIASVIGVVFYITIVTNRFYKFTKSPNRFGIHVSMLHNPTGAADFIKKYHVKGPVFSDYFVSSYLLWSLYPDFRSYIDLRDLDVFPTAFFDDYFSLYTNPQKFYELDKKYNFSYVVISTSQLSALLQDMYWGETFNLMYLDPVVCVFLKQNEQNKALNSDFTLQKLFNWPAEIEDPSWASALTKLFNPTVAYEEEDEKNSPLKAAMFFNSVKNYPTSLKVLLPAIVDFADNAEANYTLGQTYMQFATAVEEQDERARKADSARIYLDIARDLDPNYAPVYSSLANLEMMYGNYDKAKDDFEKFVELDNTNDYIYFLLGVCYRNIWDKSGNVKFRDDVITCMKRSVELNPQNGKAYLYLSESYFSAGDKEKARQYLKQAIKSDNPLMPAEQNMMQKMRTQLGM